MSVEAQFNKEGCIQSYLTTPARVGGEMVQIQASRRTGVCVRDIPPSTEGEVFVEGIFRCQKTSSLVIAEGQTVYWNDTTNKADLTGTFPIGIAIAASAASDLTVDVDLNVFHLEGLPIVKTIAANGVGTFQIYNANSPQRFRVIDMWFQCTNATDGTVKLTDGTNDITDAVVHGTVNNALKRAGSINASFHTIAAGGTLNVVVATGGNSNVNVLLLPVP